MKISTQQDLSACSGSGAGKEAQIRQIFLLLVPNNPHTTSTSAPDHTQATKTFILVAALAVNDGEVKLQVGVVIG